MPRLRETWSQFDINFHIDSTARYETNLGAMHNLKMPMSKEIMYTKHNSKINKKYVWKTRRPQLRPIICANLSLRSYTTKNLGSMKIAFGKHNAQSFTELF